ncbi:MAG: uroporphyrinogen-III C-methyltransferase [bacterium]
MLALAAGGYIWQQQQYGAVGVDARLADAMDGFEDAVARLDQRLNQSEVNLVARFDQRLKKSEVDLGARVDALRDELRAQREADAARAERLRGEMARLSSADRRGVTRWNLREAEQLMVIANQRLQWSADVALVRRALQLADGRLNQIYDPALTPVRTMLADELVALGNVPTVDVVGTLNALAALANGVDALPLAGDALFVDAESTEGDGVSDVDADAGTAAADKAAPWWQLGKDMLADLGALVQVETDGAAARPVLTGELRWMIFERAKLMLESSQLAYLRARDDAYRVRIAAARSWVVANFDIESPQVITWLARLDEIAAMPAKVRLPDISASLRALREVLRETPAQAD